MKLPKKISEALAKKAAEGGPCNIFESSEKDLKAQGYNLIDIEKNVLRIGDILSLSKDRQLWLMLDGTRHFRQNLKAPPDKISGPIYRK